MENEQKEEVIAARNEENGTLLSETKEEKVEETVLHEEHLAKNGDLLLFVDRNPLYYDQKWGKKEDPSKGISWNFAAFFLTTFWLGYRKMYGWMFASIGFYMLLEASLFGLATITELSWQADIAIRVVVSLAVSVFAGLYGNTLYYRHVKKRINRIEQYSSLTPEMKPFLIARTGGVSKWAVVGALSIYTFIGGGAAIYIGATEYEQTIISEVQVSEIGMELESLYSGVKWEYKASEHWDEDLIIFSGSNIQNGERVEITFSYVTVSFMSEYELYIREITVNNRLLSDFEVDEFMRWIIGDDWAEEDLLQEIDIQRL